MATILRRFVLALVSFAALAANGFAAPPMPAGNTTLLMMPDSTNNRLVLFNLADGSVADADYFSLQGGIPIHAIQVGYQIWISEQSGDRVSLWSLDGVYLGAIGGGAGGGLDNVRGMTFGPGHVLLANFGSENGAPGAALVRIAFSGDIIGSIDVGAVSPSPFFVLPIGTGYLVASSAPDDDIHRFNLQLEPIGTLHNSTQLNFVEQMTMLPGSGFLAAGFSSNNLVRLDSNGAVVSSITASGARGVALLGNGNYLWTNGAGAHVYDVATQTSTPVYTGGGRFLSPFLYASENLFTDGFDPGPR